MNIADGLNLDRLNNCFDNARVMNLEYIGLAVDIGLETAEIIINGKENFDKKQEYYNFVYDQSLEHKHAESVRIIGFSCANSMQELQYLLAEQTKGIELMIHKVNNNTGGNLDD